ncbi:MAG: hypothetical protein JWN78_3307 [Bacteroidota bacterium]|nr:hypothetical protein [Bacteroidota bacterium]
MEVEVKNEFRTASSPFKRFKKMLQIKSNSWYVGTARFNLDEQERLIYEEMCTIEEYKDIQKSVMLTLPMLNSMPNQYTVDNIIKNVCMIFMAKDELELIEIKKYIHEEAKAFKKMLNDYQDIKKILSKNLL